jgi:uncharacterized protein YcaQ
MLHALQSGERRVFEYWRRAASYLPMSDYRYYVSAMRAFAARRRTRDWLAGNRKLVREVLRRIRREGPLGSSDFEAPDGRKRGPWWDWKPAKRALETLFSMGELMVAERRNFQRMYDLTERVLPPGVATTPPGPDEVARFAVRRALAAQGVASRGEIRWARDDAKRIDRALEVLVAEGEVVRVEVRGLDGSGRAGSEDTGEAHFALAKALRSSSRSRAAPSALHILSPFDNMVMDRRRLARLFGFECKLECYFPAAKRKHGYFCLPLLWGEEFVGRIDPKAERAERRLRVKRLAFEPGFRGTAEVLPALAAKLAEFAAFNGCERVVVDETRPRKVRAHMRRELARVC